MLRESDRLEVEALGFTPEQALKFSFDSSDQRYAIIDDHGLIGMFGVGLNEDQSSVVGCSVGCVWLLGSDRLKDIRFTFLRQCAHWVSQLHRDYPVLWNWADVRNELHLKWLKWLGFKIISTDAIGVGGEEFHQFIRIK